MTVRTRTHRTHRAPLGRRGTAAVAVAALALLAACGNTANKNTAATTTAAAPTTVADTTKPTDAATTVPATTTPPKGVTADSITVGVSVITNPAASQGQVGTTGIAFLDQQAMVKKVVDDLNSRGGVGGKQVKVVFQVTDVSKTVDPKALVQQQCATFTQDNQIAAYVGLYSPAPEVRDCLTKANTPMFVSSGATFVSEDAKVFADTPLLVNASALNLTRSAKTLVAGLKDAGYFTAGAKVGVLRLSSPEFDRATTDGLDPALKDAGITPVAEQAIAAIQTTDDIARVSNEAASAVLKFKQAGVDHLLFFEYGGSLPFYFVNAAAAQKFAPTLGLSSLDGGQTLVQNIKTGGTVVSWEPTTDVTKGFPEWKERATCLDLIDKTRASFTTPNQEYEATRICDSFWLLAAAATSSKGDLSAQALLGGVASLGSTYVSPVVGPTKFSADQRDGIAFYRLAQYDASCSCNKFTKQDPTAIP